jgi:hypothetical protein
MIAHSLLIEVRRSTARQAGSTRTTGRCSCSPQCFVHQLYDTCSRVMKSGKRAPRLPGHLRSEQSFTSRASSPETTFNERPPSRASTVDPARSVYSQDLDFGGRDGHSQKEWGSCRPTLSPLMHSAILHGAAPKARVKGTDVSPVQPTIKSVLGLHPVNGDHSSPDWPALGASFSPAGAQLHHPSRLICR